MAQKGQKQKGILPSVALDVHACMVCIPLHAIILVNILWLQDTLDMFSPSVHLATSC